MYGFPTALLQVIMIISASVTIVSYVGAAIYALTRRSKHRRPANFILIAVGILLASWLARTTGMMVMSQFYSPVAVGQLSIASQVLGAVTNALALVCFVTAAFVDRDATTSAFKEEYLPGDTNKALSSDTNPFSSPQ